MDALLRSDLSALPPRLALGATMLYHGQAKLRGDGPAQTAQFFESLGIRPARPLALATGWTEVLSGVLTAFGIGSRLAALGILVTQSVAIAKVHKPHGFDNSKGGYEWNLALIAIALSMLVRGPGSVSTQRALRRLRA